MRAPQRVEKTGWHVVLADDDYAIVIERALKKAAGVPVAICRGATGASSTAVSAVDRQSMAVVGVLIALYFYGRVTGAF